MRWLVVSCVIVLALCVAPGAAHARRGFLAIVNTGDDIIYIRDAPADLAPTGFSKLGYHYDRLGVFWLDMWRWSGEFVLYDGNMYIPLGDQEVEALGGASVPWKYRAPPGLLALLALIELGIVTRRKRRAARMMVLGGVWIVVGLVLWLGGIDTAFVIPAGPGFHHIVASLMAIRLHAQLEATEPGARSEEPPPDREPERPHVPLRPPPPNVETDPFRAPPQPPPIVVSRPSAPTQPPVVADASAEPPKLLR